MLKNIFELISLKGDWNRKTGHKCELLVLIPTTRTRAHEPPDETFTT